MNWGFHESGGFQLINKRNIPPFIELRVLYRTVHSVSTVSTLFFMVSFNEECIVDLLRIARPEAHLEEVMPSSMA